MQTAPATASDRAAESASPSTSRAARVFGPIVAANTWRDTAWAVALFPIGLTTFCVAVIGWATAASLLPVVLLGVPVAAALFAVTKAIARWDRRQVGDWFGVVIADPEPSVRARSWLEQLRVDVGSPVRWREVAHQVYRLPMGAVTVTAAITLWSCVLVLVPLPLYGWALPEHGAAVFDVGVATTPGIVAGFLVGVTLLLTTPHLMAGLRAADVTVTRYLLGSGGRRLLTDRIDELEHTRAAVVDAAATERQRIERDLHDGAQQRLVSVAMNLGMARQRYAEDPVAAKALLDQSHAEAKDALVELRRLVRGLHPAVLTDRGLDPALSGLAAQSPVPVTVDVSISRRPSPTVEAIAYFVVSEALTNVAKHAPAAAAAVTVRSVDRPTGEPALTIAVRDNGPGGATARPGGGLAGLAGRVAGIDGAFSIDSPLGGPTTITVELPCAS